MKFPKLKLPPSLKAFIYFNILTCFIVYTTQNVSAQTNKQALYKVLTLTGEKQGARDLPQDQGITGVWQRLLKLKTTASALHTVAHPDDEHADLLTYLSRGRGVRTALLSLNRGESGGNVLGVEFFDQLGLLRTEEFLLAGSYYGLDDLYFTRLADYGFSKRVEEAYVKWEKQNVLSEMVRVIRINRPLVIVSRFHGTARDGHGNHQAAGEISQEACKLAGDSTAFPEQLTIEGLRPWKALKLYRGGVKANEHFNMQLNTGVYSPWLGQSYKNFSLLGYSLHRSQVGGHRNEVNGPFIQYYERLQSQVKSDEKENSFFDGIDTSITGIFKTTGEITPAGIEPLLIEIAAEVNHAITAFQPQNPATVIPFLTNGLSKTRSAIQLTTNQPEALFLLQIKERQFTDAINAALSINLQAMAVPQGAKEKRGFYEPQPTMGFAIAGQPFKVEVVMVNNSPVSIEPKSISLIAPANWKIENNQQELKPLQVNEKTAQSFIVTVPENATFSQPYFNRKSVQENQYQLQDKQYENLPWSAPALQVSASYVINNQLIEIQMPVQVRQANLPYGYDKYTLKVAPAIAVNIQPATGIIPINIRMKTINVEVELVNNFDGAIKGSITLKTPPGWKAQPLQTPFSFSKAGEKNYFSIKISLPPIEKKTYDIQAVATANGKEYKQGYDLISYRDLDQAILYHPAVATIKGIDVNVAPNFVIGYVMGVGDEVPAGLQQLGAKVQLLNTNDLSSGSLDQYDVIIIGTRAYAVRQDLNTYNQRLLNYAKKGGHLIVLFQTPEFVPERMAPYPAELPGNSEEISEENSPIKLLNSNHPVLNYPNKITLNDFDNWVEQRGSKFFSKWDTAYVPIISTQDIGQAPQSGGWLMAKYGKGDYTYCAYSFHRQLPYAVEGAYRIMANLISYGKK
ncbi:MAG: PIG-L family deacetylase [Chitinophagaceae bacterium]|nr:PIG-L family deacetylase [Chitinophagaceae bacterium]